jgi:hypothetical protein
MGGALSEGKERKQCFFEKKSQKTFPSRAARLRHDVLRHDVLRHDVLRQDVLRHDVLRHDVLRQDVLRTKLKHRASMRTGRRHMRAKRPGKVFCFFFSKKKRLP